MTRFDPSIFLNQLVVLAGRHVAYDQTFHRGVNIIRGRDNAVGKSTIANMIFFVLGGDDVRWTEAALQCSQVIAEVECNGKVLTISRDISDQAKRPMRMFWGEFREAIEAEATAWETYPYDHRGDSRSFSQVMFDLLGIPEVKGSPKARVTLYQMLRLMFADQESPHKEIFRHQKFESSETLAAVGALLCGYYDGEVYRLALELADLRDEQQRLRREFNIVWAVLANDEDQISGLEKLQHQLEETRTRLRKRIDAPLDLEEKPQSESREIDRLTTLTNELSETKQSIAKVRNESQQLIFEIEDSSQFLSALDNHLQALKESGDLRGRFGGARFEICPVCLTPIEMGPGDHCHLCKNHRDPEQEKAMFLRIRQQLQQQLTESRRLQEQRTQRLATLRGELPVLQNRKRDLELELELVSSSAHSAREDAVADKYRDIGYLTSDVEHLEKAIKLAAQVEKLQERKVELAADIERVEGELERRNAASAAAKTQAETAINKKLRLIVIGDIGVEKAFVAPSSVGFDFRKNEVTVNEQSNYAESSMVFLRNAFHLALHLASTEDDQFRYPRLLLLDALEEGGTTPERSQNLQRLIVELCADAPVEHQVIFTTSMIDPQLDETDLCIGPNYTDQKRVLDLP